MTQADEYRKLYENYQDSAKRYRKLEQEKAAIINKIDEIDCIHSQNLMKMVDYLTKFTEVGKGNVLKNYIFKDGSKLKL